MAWGLAQELGPRGATAVALTPGWLRSEMMLEHFGVREDNWRDAAERIPHFCISETPRLRRPRGRGARDRPGRRALERPVAVVGQLAQVYGFTDLDGTRPDAWRYIVEHRDAGLAPDDTGYR